jgi:hypothetical protein
VLEFYTIVKGIFQYAIKNILAMIAIAISVISLVRAWSTQRKQEDLQKENLKLQSVVADLSRKQIEIIDEEKNKTDISVRLLVNNNVHHFVLNNKGKVEAKNIHFRFQSDDKHAHYLVNYNYTDDTKKTVFLEILYPGDEYSIQVAFNRGPRKCEVSYSWENPDGTRVPERRHSVTSEY